MPTVRAQSLERTQVWSRTAIRFAGPTAPCFRYDRDKAIWMPLDAMSDWFRRRHTLPLRIPVIREERMQSREIADKIVNKDAVLEQW